MRTKVFALALGPAGMGTMGLYQSVANLFSTLAAFGISNSGVREIAAAQRFGDQAASARTARVLRRVSLVLGCTGLLTMAALHRPIAALSFGSESATASFGRHSFLSSPASGMLLLSFSVFFVVLSGAQSALIQGRRRISDLAKVQILGAVLATIFSIPLVLWLQTEGIVLAILVTSAVGLLSSWWYSRKLDRGGDGPTWRQTWGEAKSLLHGGGAFMTSVLLVAAVTYLARVLLVRQLGLEAAGFYTAAVTLAGLYAGFLTQAMGADFFPRLSERPADDPSCNTLVNEQTEVGLLMAAPGLMFTFVAGPIVIKAFYSAQFLAAAPLLNWLLLSVFVRMVSWPLGYLLLAKARATLYTRCVLGANCLHALLLPLAISWFGLTGAGIASLCFETVQLAALYQAAGQATSFCWASSNVRLTLSFACCLVAAAVLPIVVPGSWAMTFGAFGTAAMLLYVTKRLTPHLRQLADGLFRRRTNGADCL